MGESFVKELNGNAWCAGDRVRIRGSRKVGSVRLLNGLAGEVVGPHPIAVGWYKIRLDPNDITPHAMWSIPGDKLVRVDDSSPTEVEHSGLLSGIIIDHFP